MSEHGNGSLQKKIGLSSVESASEAYNWAFSHPSLNELVQAWCSTDVMAPFAMKRLCFLKISLM